MICDLHKWEEYLNYLNEGPYSISVVTSNLTPQNLTLERERIKISRLGFSLWSFQRKILLDIGQSTLILGLPTGLGKTYLAGAKLFEESKKGPIRVLFLVPSIPLGVQQTLFVREKLGVEAFFISGGIPPEKRKRLKVWNNAFVVATPQTFYNDNLVQYESWIKKIKNSGYPINYLSNPIKEFPFDTVVADECQRYIGQTEGYSILLAARACKVDILALSATPQLHSTKRLRELKEVFKEIRVFGINEPGIKEHVPARLLVIKTINTPKKLLSVYHALGELVQSYNFRIKKMYGIYHPRNCTRHPLCRALLAIRMLRIRLVEDGASSVKTYGTWKFRDLNNKRISLKGDTIHHAFQEALEECDNHKIYAAIRLLKFEVYNKSITYVESVEAAKQLSSKLQETIPLEEVSCLVGKGNMSMDQQASALLQFRRNARILVCTSIGEEGLDIPTADLEIWIDPPSNPRKWIQRFGRILRQPGNKKIAKTIALISNLTHEKNKLLNVKKKVESVYGFTQDMKSEPLKILGKNQKTIISYF